VLDDLGREKVSEWTGELIYAVVNARYEAGLPSVATSNLSPAELIAVGYWPAMSRLAEDGRIVEVTGPDHRLATR
jgi:primosomal protein DnaI